MPNRLARSTKVIVSDFHKGGWRVLVYPAASLNYVNAYPLGYFTMYGVRRRLTLGIYGIDPVKYGLNSLAQKLLGSKPDLVEWPEGLKRDPVGSCQLSAYSYIHIQIT